jgi:hypothetical protein
LAEWRRKPLADVPAWCPFFVDRLLERVIWTRDERRQAGRIVQWYSVTSAPPAESRGAPQRSHDSQVRSVTQSSLVLSLFPGVGLLDRAFEDEGLCLVRGPDLLWGGDVRRFRPPAGCWWGVIGYVPVVDPRHWRKGSFRECYVTCTCTSGDQRAHVRPLNSAKPRQTLRYDRTRMFAIDLERPESELREDFERWLGGGRIVELPAYEPVFAEYNQAG